MATYAGIPPSKPAISATLPRAPKPTNLDKAPNSSTLGRVRHNFHDLKEDVKARLEKEREDFKVEVRALMLLEKQKPLISELVKRFDTLQDKRESFHLAAKRPPPPKPEDDPQMGRIVRSKTRQALTLESALADPALRAHFRSFVQAAFAEENLDFWEAVEKLEMLESTIQRNEYSKAIVDRFVRQNAPDQVNLPSSLAKKLISAVDEGRTDEMFELMQKSKHEISDLMQTNFFDKFLSVVGQPAYVSDDSDDDEPADDSKSTVTTAKSVAKASSATLKSTKKSSNASDNPSNDWVRRVHPKTGHTYFENSKTGVTMWDAPKPILPPRRPISPPPYF